MGKFIETILTIILGIGIFALVFGLVFALPTMWLWNWLMPAIFGLKLITFGQACGLLFLSTLLVKGIGSPKSNDLP